MSTPSADVGTPAAEACQPVLAAGARRRKRRYGLLAAASAAVVLAAGLAVWYSTPGVVVTPPADAAARDAVAVVRPIVRLPGAVNGILAWERHLQVSVASGELRAVRVTGPDGRTVRGLLTGVHGWRSAATLLPGERYRVDVEVLDAAGRARTSSMSARTTAAQRTLKARLSPGDAAVVGVGTPVAVTFDRPLRTRQARAAVERRLQVTASPPVRGAWHWVSDREVHYRGPGFWAAGSVMSVRADLRRLALPDGVWGSGMRTSRYRVGAGMVSTVDVAAHTMTVRRNGAVLRVMPASMGRKGYETRGGTFIVLEKQAQRVMDSSTVGHPKGTPDYYRELVRDTVRITNSGTFTHAAPWSVRDQGVRNVSHGCVNLSPADAHWFFGLARRGDVVRVDHAAQGPAAGDAGGLDWNSSFAVWQQGSALS